MTPTKRPKQLPKLSPPRPNDCAPQKHKIDTDLKGKKLPELVKVFSNEQQKDQKRLKDSIKEIQGIINSLETEGQIFHLPKHLQHLLPQKLKDKIKQEQQKNNNNLSAKTKAEILKHLRDKIDLKKYRLLINKYAESSILRKYPHPKDPELIKALQTSITLLRRTHERLKTDPKFNNKVYRQKEIFRQYVQAQDKVYQVILKNKGAKYTTLKAKYKELQKLKQSLDESVDFKKKYDKMGLLDKIKNKWAERKHVLKTRFFNHPKFQRDRKELHNQLAKKFPKYAQKLQAVRIARRMPRNKELKTAYCDIKENQTLYLPIIQKKAVQNRTKVIVDKLNRATPNALSTYITTLARNYFIGTKEIARPNTSQAERNKIIEKKYGNLFILLNEFKSGQLRNKLNAILHLKKGKIQKMLTNQSAFRNFVRNGIKKFRKLFKEDDVANRAMRAALTALEQSFKIPEFTEKDYKKAIKACLSLIKGVEKSIDKGLLQRASTIINEIKKKKTLSKEDKANLEYASNLLAAQSLGTARTIALQMREAVRKEYISIRGKTNSSFSSDSAFLTWISQNLGGKGDHIGRAIIYRWLFPMYGFKVQGKDGKHYYIKPMYDNNSPHSFKKRIAKRTQLITSITTAAAATALTETATRAAIKKLGVSTLKVAPRITTNVLKTLVSKQMLKATGPLVALDLIDAGARSISMSWRMKSFKKKLDAIKNPRKLNAKQIRKIRSEAFSLFLEQYKSGPEMLHLENFSISKKLDIPTYLLDYQPDGMRNGGFMIHNKKLLTIAIVTNAFLAKYGIICFNHQEIMEIAAVTNGDITMDKNRESYLNNDYINQKKVVEAIIRSGKKVTKKDIAKLRQTAHAAGKEKEYKKYIYSLRIENLDINAEIEQTGKKSATLRKNRNISENFEKKTFSAYNLTTKLQLKKGKFYIDGLSIGFNSARNAKRVWLIVARAINHAQKYSKKNPSFIINKKGYILLKRQYSGWQNFKRWVGSWRRSKHTRIVFPETLKKLGVTNQIQRTQLKDMIQNIWAKQNN